MSRYVLTILIVVIPFFAGCGSEPDPTPDVEATVQAAIAATQAAGETTSTDQQAPEPIEEPPTDTPVPEPTPTYTPEPTETPEPVAEPFTIFELQGIGEIVSDNFTAPPCRKAVFYWEVATADHGAASLILKSHKIGSESEVILVNSAKMNAPEGLKGSSLLGLLGGEYYLSTDNTGEPWKVRVECQDGEPPVATEVDIQRTGQIVTENFELPACQKSVFHWSAEPDQAGVASLILKLHSAAPDHQFGWLLVNEAAMNQAEPLIGETLQPIEAGRYYFSSENTDTNWTLRWECED